MGQSALGQDRTTFVGQTRIDLGVRTDDDDLEPPDESGGDGSIGTGEVTLDDRMIAQ